MRSTVACSSTPARTRSMTYSWLRFSRMTESMPRRCNSCPSIRPAGPAPTMPTWVRESMIVVSAFARCASADRDALLLLDRPLEGARQELLIDGVVPRVVAVAESRAEDAGAAVVADPREGIFLL